MLHCFDRKTILAVLLVCFTGQVGYAQLSWKDKQDWSKADKAFNQGDYLSSLKTYERLYEKDNTLEEVAYKLGICNFEMKGYRKNALKYFEKVSSAEFLEAHYYLGRLYHLNGDFSKAKEQFVTYNEASGFKAYTEKEINDLIAKTETARKYLASEPELKIMNLGASVNSKFDDYAPLIPAQENVLYFTSRRANDLFPAKDPLGDHFEDIYSSERDEGKWQKPVPLDTNINTSVHDACTGLSKDGHKLLIFRTSPDLRTGSIYESAYTETGWSYPRMLKTNLNSPDHPETSACYADEGQTIFFSSDRPGGYGGKDLYMVKKLPNGQWGEPFNLGPNINTEYNEHAPYVHPSGKILFFSSEGHENMGGYDLFKSEFNEFGVFTKAENLGYPVNTIGDDIYYVLNADGSTGYFSSEREGGFGAQDIYKVMYADDNLRLNVYQVTVQNEASLILEDFTVVLKEKGSDKVYGIYKSNKLTGRIIIISESNKTYEMTIKSEGYETLIEKKKLKGDTELNFVLSGKAQ